MARYLSLLILLGASTTARAQWVVHDSTNFAQLLYLVKEARNRYSQLRNMVNSANEHKALIEKIHEGIDNSVGVLEVLGVKDEGVLSELRSLGQAVGTIQKIYGAIPKSKDALMQGLHDETIAESFKMINSFKEFSRKQEENSRIIQAQSKDASPKGAQRMQAESNALLLQGVSQLIRLQNQSLKMQSEQFALKNKTEKDSVQTYQKVNRELDQAFKKLKIGGKLPKF